MEKKDGRRRAQCDDEFQKGWVPGDAEQK